MFKMNNGLKPAAQRHTLPKRARRIYTRQVVGHITPKRGEPIPVYGSEVVDFSRYPKPPVRYAQKRSA